MFPVLGIGKAGPYQDEGGREDGRGRARSLRACRKSRALWPLMGKQREPGRNEVSSLTLQLFSPGQGGGTWAGQGREGPSGAAHAAPALQINTGL